jgi:hypothetical protein
VPLPGQRLGQVPQRLGRPPQRRFRIAALVGLHQRQQGWEEIGVAAGGRLASPTWPADAAGRQRRLAGLRLNDALADGRLADAGDLRDRAHATVAQQPRLDRQRQALLALVEVGQQDRQPGGELTTDLHRYAHAPHTTPASPKTENNTLFRSSSHRCWNLLAKVPTHAQAEVKAAFWQIFDDIDAEPGEAAVAQARQRAHAFADRYDRCYPAAVACLLDTLPELTTFLRFPRKHWTRIRRTNLIERTFGETRRRTKVIGRLPGERSCLSLVWAVLDRAGRGWRGVVMTPAGVRRLQDLRRQLLRPPALQQEVVDQPVTPAA